MLPTSHNAHYNLIIVTGKNKKSERIKLLDQIPIDATRHFGRPLRQHLIGTHDLLDRWGASSSVCMAGLFHSVYGTKTFQIATLTTGSREYVRGLIGEYSELLVFIFGMSDRKRLLLDNRSEPYAWIDHQTGEKAGLPADTLNDLVEIEVANFLEQLPFGTVQSETVMLDMRHRFECAEPFMSVQASEAFHRVLDGAAWRGFVAAPRTG